MRKTKTPLFSTILMLIMCASIIIGSTTAYFTDNVTSTGNIIASASLKAGLQWAETLPTDESDWHEGKDGTLFNDTHWEPNHTSVRYVKVTNKGNVAFQYELNVIPTAMQEGSANLMDVIDVYYGHVDANTPVITRENFATVLPKVGVLSDLIINDHGAGYGILLPANGSANATLPAGVTADTGSATGCLVLHMQQEAGNEYMNLTAGEGFKLQLAATQYTYENDAFGNTYDQAATLPVISVPIRVTRQVTPDAQGYLTQDVVFTSSTGVSAVVPAGAKVADGVTQLTLIVEPKAASEANLSLADDQIMQPYEVCIEGLAQDNLVPARISMGQVLPAGLNLGNHSLYHVEDGVTNAMTRVEVLADQHNTYTYEPATGDVSVAMATFSEVALVADTENAWNGDVATAFSGGTGTEADPYIIANADQLAYLGDRVSNDNDNYGSAYYKLIADVNIGGIENYNTNGRKVLFYPIGYNKVGGTAGDKGNWYTYGGSFKGVFDGAGHSITGIYQNTWAMVGDYDGTYYNDAMGLFGYVNGGTVKNLTIDNFYSEGEFAPTGCITAYAAGNATFENIAIIKSHPQTYNTGVAGIVGWDNGGDTEAEASNFTFKNITVDSTNTVSALWGSWDVAAAGLLGYLGEYSKATLDNCHVSATIDVYNDVCGNYQYYWYRYCGMLIGTVDKTKDDGSLDLSNITAKNCTVNFGDRHEYYYCEFVENTKASYTHDYQFSRVNNTDIVGEKGSAKCQNHNHEEHGYETVDGKSVLVEDKQAVYIPFYQLFGGYGWGVDGADIENFEQLGVKVDRTENSDEPGIGDSDDENAAKKFTVKDVEKEFTTESTITIGALFEAVENVDPAIDVDNVQVFVSPVDDSTAGGIYAANTNDWTQGTLTFSGTGAATITITDYYYCTPTTINVTITERTPETKFESKFTGDFLYRVGNQNAVKLDSLFKAKDGAAIGNVSVTVEALNGTVASGTYTSNATWTNGTIQFSGTGVVKVTITDNDYCTPTELNLEVVDAKNTTTYANATANNVVLLNDCGFSSLEVSGGYALYGNGFTMTCASDSVALDMGYAFVTLNDGTLDNVQIVCPNFDYAALYKSNLTSNDNRSETTDRTRYYNAKSGVMASGNSQILNSRISGGRAAVNVSGGNVVIDNSRIELGAVASVLVGAANNLTLRDVTLVQKPTASTYDSSKTLMGFSVLFICDANGDAAPVTLEGTLVQNAWIDENDKQYVPSAGQSIVSTVLAKTDYLHDPDGDGTKESLNLGFAYMPESPTSKVNATTITDNRTNKDTIPYEYAEVSILNGKTYVYSYKNTNGTADSFKTEAEYVPDRYSDIITVSYSDTADGLTTGKFYGTGGWVYELNVDLDKLSGYALDFSKLSMSVNGVPVTGFKVDGNAKPTSPVAVVAGGTTYTLTATVNGKEYTATYKVTGTETSKESPSLVGTPSYGAGFGVANKYGGDWSAAAPVLDGITIKYWSVADSEYKEFALSSITFANTGKQNGTNNYWEYTHTNNDFTLKLTNTAVIHSSSGTYGMPVAGKDGKLYFTIASSGGFVSTGTTSRSITIAYEFTDNNGGDTLKFSHTWSIPYSKDDQYNYSSFTSDGTLTKLETGSSSGGGTCLAEGTMITMADGSKRAVEDLRKGDVVMAYDHLTGKVTANKVIIVVKTGSDFHQNTFIFDDGSELVTINEHGIYDLNLNRYVNIDHLNANDYIGHDYVAIDPNGKIGTKKLIAVESEFISGYKYDIVTEHTLNYVAEDTLSVTHVLVDIINTFEFNDDMCYDQAKMDADIQKYGLYTYDEWQDHANITIFEEYNIPVMKVGVAKGMYTKDYIISLIDTFVLDESVQIID